MAASPTCPNSKPTKTDPGRTTGPFSFSFSISHFGRDPSHGSRVLPSTLQQGGVMFGGSPGCRGVGRAPSHRSSGPEPGGPQRKALSAEQSVKAGGRLGRRAGEGRRSVKAAPPLASHGFDLEKRGGGGESGHLASLGLSRATCRLFPLPSPTGRQAGRQGSCLGTQSLPRKLPGPGSTPPFSLAPAGQQVSLSSPL